ncbi:MAG: HNH endonuclease [Desulfamplus sp.]|nr:HNH endonuclease [Desulfamplus sp.]
MKKFCGSPGCPNLVERPARFCEEHYNPPKKVPDKFYLSMQWRRFRDSFRARNPICTMCGQAGQLVDHVNEVTDGGELLDPGNCQTLCHACHNTKTRRERIKRKGKQVYTY